MMGEDICIGGFTKEKTQALKGVIAIGVICFHLTFVVDNQSAFYNIFWNTGYFLWGILFYIRLWNAGSNATR